jgi:hypothetical protein
VPLYRMLFGMHGMMLRIRLLGRILAKVCSHLDY